MNPTPQDKRVELPELPEPAPWKDGGAYTADQMRAYALAAIANAVPTGYRLVPVEPTEAMITAAADCQDADPEDGYEGEVYHTYKAMLAAAPEPDSNGIGATP